MLFERRAESWIAPLFFDAAYLNATIFTAHYYFQKTRQLTTYSLLNQNISQYLTQALSLLRERIEYGDDAVRTSDVTAATIMTLAGYAHISGDYISARHHMRGLHRIVSLRGGIDRFRGSSAKLIVEILRYCLILACIFTS
jgi:hypothetical protein